MANEKSKELRKSLADKFIASINDFPSEWKKQWVSHAAPRNGKSGRKYSGLNRFILCNKMFEEKYMDPRFYTFKQIQEMGHKLAKGSHGTKVEFWSFYDPAAKKTLSYAEAQHLQLAGEKVVPISRLYTVFNGSQIEGLSPFKESLPGCDVKQEDIIKGIAENMNVPIFNDGGDRAFYEPSTDSIHVPITEAFKSQVAYNSTILHELGHATGAEKRLHRGLKSVFGTEAYAKEELTAEITSCFAMSEFGFEALEDENSFENHKAYIQSWIEAITEKPEVLMNAIRQAEKATDYLMMAYEKSIDKNRDQNQEQQPTFNPKDFAGLNLPKEVNSYEASICREK